MRQATEMQLNRLLHHAAKLMQDNLTPEQRAAERIMDAAPELLVLCKRMRDAPSLNVRFFLRDLIAVIAKAEGES